MSATTVNLQIPGGNATPGPPVSTALGSKGVSPRDFCLQFNALTQNQKGAMLRVDVTVYPDKKFDIHIKGVPSVDLLKERAKIKKGSSEPNRNKVGSLTRVDLEEIAQKMGDGLQAFSLEARCRVLEGTARSMGLKITQ